MEKYSKVVLFIFSLLMSSATVLNVGAQSNTAKQWFRTLCLRKPKQAILRFYVHDALGGPNATVWEVAEANITNSLRSEFGQVRVLDNLITVAPDRNSKKLGRVQGLITSADLSVSAYAMNVNFVFTSGKYNGSSLCMLGRNPIDSKDRELPLVGGTGVFRMARGFSISNLYSFDTTANYGVLEYVFYVSYV